VLKLGDYGGRATALAGMLAMLYDCIFTDPGPKTWIGDTYYYFHAPWKLAALGLFLTLAGLMCGVICNLARNKKL
jgi:hypothetical protein